MNLLSVENLSIALPKGADRALAVKDVSFTLDAGEILCIVGESGSGKSMSANALMGLLPEGVTPAGGSITFQGRDILALPEPEMRALRGRDIAMIFQEPLSALNPLMRIGDQIAEVFEAHNLLTTAERHKRALQLLHEVGLPEPETTIRAYPFQLSGGQRQRVVIAMALALEPKILVADEPTTALDVTTQAQILDLIEQLRVKRGMAVLFITHDFGVVADIADRVIVMQTGEVVEAGLADKVLLNPVHPYTRALLDAIPRLSFHEDAPTGTAADPILSVRDLCMTFTTRTSGFFAKPRVVHAVNNASFDLYKGETIGIVGESGSGKSTLGRCLVRLLNPQKGVVEIGGQDISKIKGQALHAHRRRIQMVFQDPYSSLNPRARIGTILTDGLIAYGMDKGAARTRAQELLTLVGLDPSAMARFPHEFSGGQRQRVGIARALDPEVIVADEAVSALDVSIQAQVLDLLAELKARLNLSMIFITHDLRVAAQVCDRIIVMQRGEMVEFGPSAQVLGAPRTDYTRSLLDAQRETAR